MTINLQRVCLSIPPAALLAGALLLLGACQPAESPSLAKPGTRVPDASRTAPTGQVLKGRGLRVQDGDSFVVRLEDGSNRTIRLSGVDAPERGQPHADASQQNLRRLVDGRDLQVDVAKMDAYGRAVAQVFVEQDGKRTDVGLAQVAAGMAWFYRRYRRDLPPAAGDRYEEAERAARARSQGLWQADDPQPPWEFRRRQEPEPTTRR